MKLPMRALGGTAMAVSAIGLGTVKFGRNTDVKYPDGFALPEDREIRDILAIARDMGINLIDTAPAYGNSEERLGRLLDNRQDWLICSKAGEEYEGGQSRFDFSAAHIRHSVERSLRRLGTDYLDIVLVHSDGHDERIIRDTDCFAALQRCREEGLIRAFGLSGKTAAGGLLALEQADVAMVTYNPSQTEEEAVIDRAWRQHKGVLVKKALNSGHALTRSSGAGDAVQANMDFIFAHPGVSSVIIGSINPLHLRHNVQAACRTLNGAGN